MGEIGGFVRPVLWDGIDCHRARMLGWIAESIDLEPIRFVHLRPRGASHNGAFGPGGFGLASGSTSWAPRPFTYLSRANLPGAAMLWGYLRSWLKGVPRYIAPASGMPITRHPEVASMKRTEPPEPPRAVYFLGSRFDTGSIEEAVCNIMAETGGCFKYVVTPNVHHMVRLLEDPTTMRPCYERAWRVFCDSRVLSRLAWFSGLRLPVITGSDLTARLIARAEEQRLTIALIGPTAAACAALGSRYPGLNIVFHTPPMGFIKSPHELQKCVDFAVKTQAPLIFLATGMPQQEILAYHIADHPQARGVGLCIGASIDFLTGKQRRAPVWVQKANLEWLYRLLSDPRRLASRYLIVCPRIFYLICFKLSKS